MADISDEQRKEVEHLVDSGFASLREGDYEDALKIAEKVEAIGHTAAFDIAAQAYAALDELEKAVAVLERGVEKAPDCWLNWHLLGNYYSDLEQYSKSETAYERALACTDAWEACIRMNQAILMNRCGDYERSLSFLDGVRDTRLSLRLTGAKVIALEGLGKLDEALALAEACLAEAWEDDEAGETLAYIAAVRGRIQLEKGRAAGDVRHEAMEVVAQFGGHTDLLALIRDLDGQYSRKAKYFRLNIHGSLPEGFPFDEEVQGYYVNYDVVAESAPKALEWVREFEELHFPSVDLQVENAEVLEKRPKDPMGVYAQSGHIFYADEEDE